MRLSITHTTRYEYETAPRSLIQLLRLTPCETAGQTVRDWRVEVSTDAVLRKFEDAYGNINNTFTLEDPPREVEVTAVGTVETAPTSGVVSGSRERLPVSLYLRDTDMTQREGAVLDIASKARAAHDGSALDLAHKVNAAVHETMDRKSGETFVATPAAAALSLGKGVFQDFAHAFVAAARHEGLPARYVSGYHWLEARAPDDHAGHAWAEAYVSDLGWVSFDPSTGLSTTDAYVRVAVGLDYFSAAPVRGAIYGGGGESLSVSVSIERPQSQSQSMDGMQSQSQRLS